MILIILCISLFFLFIIQSPECIPSAAEALKNCIFILIPSIFPFMVLTEILSKTNFFNLIQKKSDKIAHITFRISGNAFPVVILGYLCGFPAAAKLISHLYQKNQISYEDAIKLSVFTNNPGPLFVIGTVGYGILDSTSTGIKLFIIQLVSSLLTGMLINRFINIQSITHAYPQKLKQNATSPLHNITESISSSFQVMIPITGTIVFFAFLTEAILSSGIIIPIINLFGVNKEFTENLLRAIFELSNGIINLTPLINNDSNLFILLSAILSWSGISVHMQILNFYTISKIETKYYFIGKFTTIIFSVLLSTIFIILI